MPRRPLPAALLALGLLLPLFTSGSAYSSSTSFVPSRIASISALSSIPASAFVQFADPTFERVWSRTDLPVARGDTARSWLWGPETGSVHSEPFSGAPGGTRTVQYFDKARMEVNPASSDPNSQWAVTTGLLVVELVSGRVQTGPDSYQALAPADVPVAGDAAPSTALDTAPRYSSFHDVASLPAGPDRKAPATTGAQVTATIDRTGKVGSITGSPPADVRYSAYSQETGHNIPDVFARYMQTQGLIYDSTGGNLRQDRLFDPTYLLGYPITEAYWTTVPVSDKSVQVLVQLYQRRVLTYTPGFDPNWQVQMGNVGQHYYAWRYSRTQAPAPAPAQPSPTPSTGAGDTFVHAVGNRLYYAGKPITLKGTNYWLHDAPFGDTWLMWDAPAMKAELAKAKDLGVNVIRIGIPYGTGRATDVVWGLGCQAKRMVCNSVNGTIVSEMTQFLEIAQAYDMKVLFTLFEWSDPFPLPGDREYALQLAYLKGIVTPFANDDRVLGWDLHNEPENYDTWAGGGGAGTVIAWADNMAKVLRTIDSKHLLTVGVAHYDSLWVPGPKGRTLLDIVDVASFHCYDAGGLSNQIKVIVAHTNKPVLLEEMGWPTGPTKLNKPGATYDEATQQFLYHSMLADARATTLVGIIQWALWDNPPNDDRYFVIPSIEPYFGLVRLDGSLKPAASDFRNSYPASPAAPLPSTTRSDEPLIRNPEQ